MRAEMFAAAEAVADAILYEGYLLYPYRRSSAKNRVRWQFGVLTAREWIDRERIPDPGVAGSSESWFQQMECLLEAPPATGLTVRVRFLQLQRRQVHAASGDGGFTPVDALDVDGDGGGTVLSFDEAVPQQADVAVDLDTLLDAPQDVPIDRPGAVHTEAVTDREGRIAGRITRTTWPLSGTVHLDAERAATPFAALRLRVRVENLAPLDDSDHSRDGALRRALLATHVLVHVDAGRFLSLLDPPAWAAGVAAECVQRHVFPVLAGADDGDDVVLCSPILLYDHPKVAPESPGDLHDAAEIDEILSLRTLTLTDAEKREARATDPRAAAIVDRVETLPPELMARLHGAVRDLRPTGADDDELPWWDPRAEAAVDPDTDTVRVGGRIVGKGDVVRLHPRGRGSDAHDMFLSGRTARVHAVLTDVDGSIRVAVTVDDDPAADLHEWYGRFFHFTPEEIEPIEAAQ